MSWLSTYWNGDVIVGVGVLIILFGALAVWMLLDGIRARLSDRKDARSGRPKGLGLFGKR